MASVQFQDAYDNWYTASEFETLLVNSELFTAAGAADFVGWFQDPTQGTPPSQQDIDNAEEASGGGLKVKTKSTIKWKFKWGWPPEVSLEGETTIETEGTVEEYVEAAEQVLDILQDLMQKIKDWWTGTMN